MTAKVWRYSVPNDRAQHEGWAILFLDNAGCFATLSDYGNYSYRWPMNGMPEGQGIREFVLRCDNGYLMGKLSPEQEYDGEETLKNVKRTILEARHEGRMSADDARAEFDLLEDFDDLEHEHDFVRWTSDTKLEEYWELSRHKHSIHAHAFLERAWPRLKKLIEAELEGEVGETAQRI